VSDAGFNLKITGTTGREYDGYFLTASDADLADTDVKQGWMRTTLTAQGAAVFLVQSSAGTWVLDAVLDGELQYPVYLNAYGNNDPTKVAQYVPWLKRTCGRCDLTGFASTITIQACAL
jgi:hypothetical protein